MMNTQRLNDCIIRILGCTAVLLSFDNMSAMDTAGLIPAPHPAVQEEQVLFCPVKLYHVLDAEVYSIIDRMSEAYVDRDKAPYFQNQRIVMMIDKTAYGNIDVSIYFEGFISYPDGVAGCFLYKGLLCVIYCDPDMMEELGGLFSYSGSTMEVPFTSPDSVLFLMFDDGIIEWRYIYKDRKFRLYYYYNPLVY